MRAGSESSDTAKDKDDISLPAYHYRPTSSVTENWLLVHVRRMFVHTFHHHTLAIAADGRVAVATGPFLTILHPPPVTPFRPTLNPPLRLVYSDENVSTLSRKDTLSTTSHLTYITWAHHNILLLSGFFSLYILKPPPYPDTLNFSPNSSCHFWVPQPLSLPHQQLDNSHVPKSRTVRCLAHTRIFSSTRHGETEQTIKFFPYIAYGTDYSAELFPSPVSSQSSNPPVINLSHFRIHSVCTTAIACVDGIQTSSDFVTAVALADVSLLVTVYSISLNFKEDQPSLSSQKVWASSHNVPPGPVISMSWSLHSTGSSLLILAIAMGNDVVIVHWTSTAKIFDSHTWTHPQIHCVRDAHDHVVTAVQVCHDGSVASASMDGRVICWRVNPIPHEAGVLSTNLEIAANILQERSENNEPVMALERTVNAFALVTLTSTSRHGQEVCDSEVMRKYTGTQRRTVIRVLVSPPNGTPDQIQMAIISCAQRLMNHPSLLDQPLTYWDVSHFLHSIPAVSEEVVPRLRTRLVEMVEAHENGQEKIFQQFVHRCRVLLWLARVIDHPDGVNEETHNVVRELSRRIRNSILFVRYLTSLQNFLTLVKKGDEQSETERLSLGHMCQFVSAWHVLGLALNDSTLHAVREVQRWLEPFAGQGENLSNRCTVCDCSGSETVLVADGMDPSSVWCTAGHSFSRCVVSALPLVDSVSLECSACRSRACRLQDKELNWIKQRGHCPLCNGGLVSAHSEAN